MSLYGMMRTSVSGMAAQASRLATISDNIANSSTTGYKGASTEFSTIVLASGGSEYTPGNVGISIRRDISQQGGFAYTKSVTSLAVDGSGFFLVADASGQPFMTRAGSFVPHADGTFVNAAGYRLLGYSLADGAPSVVANGYAGLEPVVIDDLALQSKPSTQGVFSANLPAGADPVAPANLPSTNSASAAATAKTSLLVYDNLGGEVTLDIHLSKVSSDTWEVAVFNGRNASASGGFPYTSPALQTTTLTFDPATGHLSGTSPTELSIAVPGGAELALDISQFSLSADYAVRDAAVNGSAPSAVDQIDISEAGELYAVFENGMRVALYRIPLADVPSPDNLQALSGNVFVPSANSGDVRIGFPGSGGLGDVVSGALEQSTVDLGSELTSMIESQRNYTANSKVFQTGADLMDVLVNLKR
jgi:flagellar hook protein FlgE